MKKVIITKGLPGSGKSFWAKSVVDKQPSKYKIIEKDMLRAMLDNGKWSGKNEKFILKIRNNLIIKSLEDGYNVIISDTNFGKHEEDIKRLVSDNKDKVGDVLLETMFFDVPVEECIKRDLKRLNSVGKDVIMGMYNKFLKPEKEKVKWVSKKKTAIIVDIDGTLAIMKNRTPFEYQKVHQDEVSLPIADIVEKYQDHVDIIILSGREDNCRDVTEQWLKDKNIKYTALLMRKTGDFRKDSIVKEEIFREFVEPVYNVLFVLDDRNSVVEMWRDIGLACLQVAYGDF